MVAPYLLINPQGSFLLKGGEAAHHPVGAGPARVFPEGLGALHLTGLLNGVGGRSR